MKTVYLFNFVIKKNIEKKIKKNLNGLTNIFMSQSWL